MSEQHESDSLPEGEDTATVNTPQAVSPRRRLQELLAIPDNQRSEAEWDELNELEIMLAPGNRAGAPMPGPGPGQGQGPKRHNPHNNPHAGGAANANANGNAPKRKKPFKKFHKKAAKTNPA
jgi:hypothetical protein